MSVTNSLIIKATHVLPQQNKAASIHFRHGFQVGSANGFQSTIESQLLSGNSTQLVFKTYSGGVMDNTATEHVRILPTGKMELLEGADMGNKRITGVATATSANDAINKAMYDTHTTRLNTLDASLAIIDIPTIDASLSLLTDDVQTLDASLSLLTDDVQTLDASLSLLTTDVQTLDTSLSLLTDDVQTLDASLNTIQPWAFSFTSDAPSGSYDICNSYYIQTGKYIRAHARIIANDAITFSTAVEFELPKPIHYEILSFREYAQHIGTVLYVRPSPREIHHGIISTETLTKGQLLTFKKSGPLQYTYVPLSSTDVPLTFQQFDEIVIDLTYVSSG
jgi:hypothetical protein